MSSLLWQEASSKGFLTIYPNEEMVISLMSLPPREEASLNI